VYFDNHKGVSGYYDAQGKPIQKLFLKALLNYRRISSGFSYNRMHPVYHKMRPHLGVDYAAPTGTPIVALGDGKVVYKGWSNGFGESLRIQHRNGYITYYGHLSRYAKGMSKGKQVKQGQVIGYVGATGVATGPHLDFRVKSGGSFINPLKLKSVTGPALKGNELNEFKEKAAGSLVMLDDPSLNNGSISSRKETSL
ncbi:MAG TPA: M23 family metallopeptidase, partial [Deltaproteobacteria bacterium]|nr:M23 family metallopeptidase [Deltaproteobacteria bacterium]